MLLLFCYYFVVVVVVVVMLLLFSCCCHVAIVTYCCLDCSDKLITEFFYKVADIQTDRATTRGPIGPKNAKLKKNILVLRKSQVLKSGKG